MSSEQADRDQHFPGPGSKQLSSHRVAQVPSPQYFHGESYLQDEEEEGLDLLALWRTIGKRKWTIFTVFLIVVIAGTVASFLETPIYRASLTLQIERETPKVLEYQNVGQASTGDRDFYQTQFALLKSHALAEKVSEELSSSGGTWEFEQPSLWDWLTTWLVTLNSADEPSIQEHEATQLSISPGALLGNLQVSPVGNSSIVRLSYDSPNPRFATRVVNTWADTFMQMNLQRRVGASSYAADFLRERLQQMKVKLEESERELIEFANQEEIVNLDDRQTIGTQRLQAISNALNQAEQDRIKAESVYHQIQRTSGQGFSQILDSSVIQELKQTKVEMEAEYQEKLKIYKPAYPKMRQLESQINQLQSRIDEEIAHIREAIRASYESTNTEVAMLKSMLEEAKEEAITLQNRGIQYNILKREVDTNRELYDGLLQRYKEVGVAGTTEANNISIVDKAQVPGNPIKPNHRKNIMLAIFLGLLGGIGLALFFEYLDDTLKEPEDLERRLGIPVLGVIPLARNHVQQQQNLALPLVVQEDPRSMLAEAYRSIRTALQFSTSDGVPRVLLITSPAMSEGKTTTALSLAIQFTQVGKKVLLIDADLRKPTLHRDLNMENSEGLTNHLTQDAKPADIAKPTIIPNLFFVSAGPLPPNPAELLASAKMMSFLSLAAEKFDQVILDSPPVLGLADALILGNLAGGTLLVVEAGSTRRGPAQNSLKRLKTARTHLLGGIINKLDARRHAYGYYYDSYYYYADSPASKRLTA